MSRKKPPEHLKIALANLEMLNGMKKFEFDGAVELSKTCWACGQGFDDGKPERAHIHAHSFGGSNEPENFFLLCGGCHADQPDGLSRELQVKWLENHEPWYSERLFARRYPKSHSALKRCLSGKVPIDHKKIREVIESVRVAATMNSATYRANVDFAAVECIKNQIKSIINERIAA